MNIAETATRVMSNPDVPALNTRWRYYGGIGSRATPADVLADMTKIARWQRARKRVLRSGAADGADDAFELGAGYFSEIRIPWRKFPFIDVADADEFYLTISRSEWFAELERRAKRLHPSWQSLSIGGRALMTRNMAQLYGAGPNEPRSEYLIGYAERKPNGEWKGGTGQAFRAASEILVPIVNFWTPAGNQSYASIVEHILAIEATQSKSGQFTNV